MAELFKFRCYQCQKLLGAPPSKIGSVVHCPKCRTELIVPPPMDDPPSDQPEDPDDPPIRLEDLGLRIDLQAEPPTKILPPTDEPSPVAFLEQAAARGDAPDPSGAPAGPDEDDGLSGLPEPPDPLESPLVPRPRRGRRAAPRSELLEPVARRRDVVLPRTAAVAWSMFALLGLAAAFASGLLVGHFLWR